jgi:hypothetical protein
VRVGAAQRVHAGIIGIIGITGIIGGWKGGLHRHHRHYRRSQRRFTQALRAVVNTFHASELRRGSGERVRAVSWAIMRLQAAATACEAGVEGGGPAVGHGWWREAGARGERWMAPLGHHRQS